MDIPLAEQLKALSFEIRGAAMEVYNHFGPGLLESLYEKALILELQMRDIRVESQGLSRLPTKGTLSAMTTDWIYW